EKEVSKQKKEKKIQSKGKKGSKNKKDKFKDLAPTFRLLKEQLTKVKQVLTLNIKHFVGD
ncbi:MAG: hypothetical protein H7263_10935, partial [Candidatus Sericytochromatia bacterium]|nr:hypothetical protein [Candidatus Sericytochromatia bacterium]